MFDPTWLGFLAPKISEKPKKIDSKRHQKFDQVLDRFFIDFIELFVKNPFFTKGGSGTGISSETTWESRVRRPGNLEWDDPAGLDIQSDIRLDIGPDIGPDISGALGMPDDRSSGMPDDRSACLTIVRHAWRSFIRHAERRKPGNNGMAEWRNDIPKFRDFFSDDFFLMILSMFYRFFIDFGAMLATFLGPRRPKRPPRRFQDASKTISRRLQDDLKTETRASAQAGAPHRPRWFGHHFRTILEANLTLKQSIRWMFFGWFLHEIQSLFPIFYLSFE